jgi:Big-like domain-containing protein
MRRLFLLVALVLAAPAQAAAADLHATPSTFASTFASAQGGDNVLLASGTYGSFGGGTKSSVVTVKPEDGATVTMAGASFNGASNITVQGVSFGTSQVVVYNGSKGITFADDTWGAYNAGGSYEGRLSVIQGSEVSVKDSHFGPGGCSDGIQASGGGGAAGVVVVDGTEFEGIRQGSCAAHVDAIQLYGGIATITDSYFHDVTTGVMTPDGNGSPLTLTNNVFVGNGEYAWAVIDGGGRNDTIKHNAIVNWTIEVGRSNAGVSASNVVIRDNAIVGGDVTILPPQLSSAVLQDHNAAVTFTRTGTGRCAYATASPKGTASDGTDIGLNDCGSAPSPSPPPAPDPPPPPDPPPAPPPPTADHQPSARFTVSPASPVIGQPVTFDATDSTCDDTPCSYTWVDDGFDGSGGSQWPLGNGRTLSFTFRGAGVKNVRLTVADADRDVDTTVRAVTLTTPPATAPPPDDPPPPPDNPPPPPIDNTPPDTTIVSGASGTTTDSTPTFTFTSSESDPAFECRVDSGSWADCTSPWTTVALSDGDHSVAVRSTDVAGNTDASPATRTFTVDTGPLGGELLLGSSTVQPVADSIAAGSAEAFEATASRSGSPVNLSVYVGFGNTATAMVAGLYSDAGGHPGTLLTKGTLPGVTALAWNDITVSGASLVSGQKYWLALLGIGGTLTFRDDLGFSCHSEVSISTTLTTLPSTWQTGAAWPSCNISGHASA